MCYIIKVDCCTNLCTYSYSSAGVSLEENMISPFLQPIALDSISCRYNPGGVFKISNDIMDNPGDAKYGMTTEQIFEAFRTLKAKGAENFGIHAFLASNTVTNEYYPMLAKVMFELAVKLQKETGAHIG